MSNLTIDGKELHEDERLKYLADHRNEDLELDRDDLISAIYWTYDSTSGLPVEPRNYPADPLAAHESDFKDDPGAPAPDAYTAAEKRSRAFWQRVTVNVIRGFAVGTVGFLLYTCWKWLAVHGYFWWLPNY